MPSHGAQSDASARAAFIHSPELESYHYPEDCPFSTDRAGRARRTLQSMGLLSGSGRREVAPEPAGRRTLLGFHKPRYLEVIREAERGHLDEEGLHMGLGTEETPVFVGMYEYAALACGGTLKGAELILADEVDVAFNPSGGYHHAEPSLASGFCYLNDVVLACMKLTAAGRRVLFLDIDAHHGDGVQNAFYDRADVMTISFHETGHSLYPGTGFEDEVGVGAGRGYCANVPLPKGVYDDAWMLAFRAVAEPLTRAYDPDVIVLEAGMDCLSGDPLTHLDLTNNAYAEAVERMLRFGKPLLAVGGGGYHIANTARGWALLWTVLCGQDAGPDDLAMGLGGVMMGTTDWAGGLRDRMLIPSPEARINVGPAIQRTIEKVKANVFPYHGL
jgi:acetoin utilization protein AcuC